MTRLLMAALGLLSVAAGISVMMRDITTFPELSRFSRGLVSVSVGDAQIQTMLATTPEQWEKGLSGQREPVRPLLFIFNRENDWGIWMKDMVASIDVLWIDAEKKVIHIETELLPASYPRVYRASLPSMYVLEVPAGYVELFDMKVGDSVSW